MDLRADKRRAAPKPVTTSRLRLMVQSPARVLQGDARISLKAGELKAMAAEILKGRHA